MTLTKGEMRRARKRARQDGTPYIGNVSIQGGDTAVEGPAMEFSESAAGLMARERWARRYDDLDGAPEGDWDR